MFSRDSGCNTALSHVSGSGPAAQPDTTVVNCNNTPVALGYRGVAIYKNAVVAIKQIRYTKKTREITRATKIQMKHMRELHNANVNNFMGIILMPNSISVVREFCAKGSLFDVLRNDDIRLDQLFIASFIEDLLKGMLYIHDSDLKVHGNLKSTNCVITNRWVLQVSDFGLHELRDGQILDGVAPSAGGTEHDDARYDSLLWTAPELLRAGAMVQPLRGTQRADVYAVGIVLHEVVARRGPFDLLDQDANVPGLSSRAMQTVSPDIRQLTSETADIVYHVKDDTLLGLTPFRPRWTDLQAQAFLLEGMRSCWAELADDRPDLRSLRSKLKPLFVDIMKRNLMDHMMAMMEQYQGHLEELVDERTHELFDEKRRVEWLLHRMLPQNIASQLLTGREVEAESYEAVTIYFSDIVGFTQLSAESTPMQVVGFLNALYTLFDRIIHLYDVYKVETIGDAYMCVSGVPIRNGHRHAGECATMALHLLDAVKSFRIPHMPHRQLALRVGLHTGPCAAGVVGQTMPRYCLFGDTVNTASRMESNGEPLRIHCSEQTSDMLHTLGGYVLEPRGLVPMKGKGEMRTYWLVGKEGGVSAFNGPTGAGGAGLGTEPTAVETATVELDDGQVANGAPPRLWPVAVADHAKQRNSYVAATNGRNSTTSLVAVGQQQRAQRPPTLTLVRTQDAATVNRFTDLPVPVTPGALGGQPVYFSDVQNGGTISPANSTLISDSPLIKKQRSYVRRAATQRLGMGARALAGAQSTLNQMRYRRYTSNISTTGGDTAAAAGGNGAAQAAYFRANCSGDHLARLHGRPSIDVCCDERLREDDGGTDEQRSDQGEPVVRKRSVSLPESGVVVGFNGLQLQQATGTDSTRDSSQRDPPTTDVTRLSDEVPALQMNGDTLQAPNPPGAQAFSSVDSAACDSEPSDSDKGAGAGRRRRRRQRSWLESLLCKHAGSAAAWRLGSSNSTEQEPVIARNGAMLFENPNIRDSASASTTAHSSFDDSPLLSEATAHTTARSFNSPHISANEATLASEPRNGLVQLQRQLSGKQPAGRRLQRTISAVAAGGSGTLQQIAAAQQKRRRALTSVKRRMSTQSAEAMRAAVAALSERRTSDDAQRVLWARA